MADERAERVDDGALQQRLDEQYGANAVRVVPQLVDAG